MRIRNIDVETGLLKAIVYGMHFRRYDAELMQTEYENTEKLPKHLTRDVLTAFTIQVGSLFDEGLNNLWHHYFEDSEPPRLGAKINELKKKAAFLDPASVEAFVSLRNRLAHDKEAFATWEEFDWSCKLVQDELRNSKIIR
jgi:hypothetical protein